MTCDIIRLTVSLKTGETIARGKVGEKDIAEDDYLRAMSRAVTGMDIDTLAEKTEAYLKETKHGTGTDTGRDAAGARPRPQDQQDGRRRGMGVDDIQHRYSGDIQAPGL